MSPLPEVKPSRDLYTTEPVNIRGFFDKDINKNEMWEWHVDIKNKFELFAAMGVSFKNSLDGYWEKKDEKAVFYKIFSTMENGVYLKISSNDVGDLENPKLIFKNVKDFVFVRLGEDLNKEYLDSLLNG